MHKRIEIIVRKRITAVILNTPKNLFASYSLLFFVFSIQGFIFASHLLHETHFFSFSFFLFLLVIQFKLNLWCPDLFTFFEYSQSFEVTMFWLRRFSYRTECGWFLCLIFHISHTIKNGVDSKAVNQTMAIIKIIKII